MHHRRHPGWQLALQCGAAYRKVISPWVRRSQTIAFTSNPTNPTYLGSYTVTASAAGGPVTFSADPASVSCSVSGGTVSFTGVGTCIIDANQGGDADYTAAQQKQQQFDVAQASQSITFTSTAPTCPCTPGQQYTVTATGGGSGNAVTFNIDPSSTVRQLQHRRSDRNALAARDLHHRRLPGGRCGLLGCGGTAAAHQHFVVG